MQVAAVTIWHVCLTHLQCLAWPLPEDYKVHIQLHCARPHRGADTLQRRLGFCSEGQTLEMIVITEGEQLENTHPELRNWAPGAASPNATPKPSPPDLGRSAHFSRISLQHLHSCLGAFPALERKMQTWEELIENAEEKTFLKN